MPTLVRRAPADPDAVTDALAPRRAAVREVEVAPGVFTGVGPVSDYRRTVRTEGDEIVQEVRYDLAIPYFGFLFARPVRGVLGRIGGGSRSSWWLPPEPLDAQASRSLACMAVLTLLTGYLATLLTQTVVFAAQEFGSGKGAQGVALAAVRFDVILSLAVVAVADRRGRRLILLVATGVGAVLTALGAAAPNLAALAGSQVLARGFVTAAAVVITIMAAEEMPAGARAYAVSLLSMVGALGAGVCVLLLPVTDLGPSAWRLLYVLPLAFVPVVLHVRSRLPESRRYVARHAAAPVSGHGRRFWLLAVSAFLLAVFTTPAAQFQNTFLREERGFSAAHISLFTVATNTPGGIGVVVGGRLADLRGRRLVGSVAVFVGVGATVAMFLSAGWLVWAWSVVGAVIGAAAVPALGVYGPELFPTSLRGKANGVITGLGRFGSVIGLLVAGFTARSLGRIGPGLALLAAGPLALCVLILVAYPETAHRELEELNPEDGAAREGDARAGTAG